jgi:hypothetical protein
MRDYLDTKVVLKQTVLHGSNRPDLLQRVATVYISGAEYRVYAPPEARGETLDWVQHLFVRQLADLNSEVGVNDALSVLAVKVVKEELEKRHSEVAPMKPNERDPSSGISGALDILKQSIKHVPANKYAFGVVGIVAAASISTFLAGGQWQAAVAGGVVMLGGMVVLRVFSAGGSGGPEQPDPHPAAQVLTWFCIATFAVVLSLFVGKLYLVLFPPPGINPAPAFVPKPSVIPPDRLLSSSPVQARLDYCTVRNCDIGLMLKGYDPGSELRYKASVGFKQWRAGQVMDTYFHTPDELYFNQNEKVAFRLYCKLDGEDDWLPGAKVIADWSEEYEKSKEQAHVVWTSCENEDDDKSPKFKASVGIAVRVATARINESVVQKDLDQPGQALVPASTELPTKAWTDPSTGLMWAGSDNGKNVTWAEADNFCREKLKIGPYSSGWRLPKVDELRSIFDPQQLYKYTYHGQSYGGMKDGDSGINLIRNGVKLNSCCAWSEETATDDSGLRSASYFRYQPNPRDNIRNPSIYPETVALIRALCVRSP